MLRTFWTIQTRQPCSRTFRCIERRQSADEALHVWARLVSRARSGETGRRGEARLVGPDGKVREVVNVSELVRMSEVGSRMADVRKDVGEQHG
jgi:hypothetical protein